MANMDYLSFWLKKFTPPQLQQLVQTDIRRQELLI